MLETHTKKNSKTIASKRKLGQTAANASLISVLVQEKGTNLPICNALQLHVFLLISPNVSMIKNDLQSWKEFWLISTSKTGG